MDARNRQQIIIVVIMGDPECGRFLAGTTVQTGNPYAGTDISLVMSRHFRV